MSGVPRIKRVINVEHDKRPQNKLINTSFDKKPVRTKLPNEWQYTFQARGLHINDDLSIPIFISEQKKESENSNKDSEEQENKKTNNSFLSQTSSLPTPAITFLDQASFPLNMKRLAGLISVFVARSTDHSIWAVQIPLSHTLLKETVLYMRCEQSKLTIKFETPDWDSRETLLKYSPMLLQMLSHSSLHLSEITLLTN